MKIAAVILAAGSSSRFGQPKALLEWQGETLLQRNCRIAKESGHDPILVVTSPSCQYDIPDYAQKLSNPDHERGMGTSLGLAAVSLTKLEVDALMVLFPDQPAISSKTLGAIHSAFSPPEITIVIADSGEHSGPPVLFSSQHFSALSKLTGDQGGKQFVQNFSNQTRFVFIPEARWDIDTPEIWQKFLQENGHSS